MIVKDPNLFATPRCAPRYYFCGAAELTDESGHMSVAMVRTLSRYGCFIKTNRRFRADARIALTITDAGSQFSAKVRVANEASDSFEVEFLELSARDKAELESCIM